MQEFSFSFYNKLRLFKYSLFTTFLYSFIAILVIYLVLDQIGCYNWYAFAINYSNTIVAVKTDSIRESEVFGIYLYRNCD
jgi:hypothetical protein